ncbi:MAG TPA: SigE family RNA polymerase sigma factor [Kineosporiaceae bacterium]|nr:SigE family RNA polymerase sigma factor [Kineosporiaceae bacterium]
MNPEAEADFRAFVTARSGPLLRTARLLTDQAHAEDLLQEALSRLVPRWGAVDDPEAYVRVTMHRLQISRWRRRGVLREDAVEDPPVRQLADLTGTVDDRMVLRRALARLSPRQRAVLVCRYVEDLDEVATARMLGIRVGTVRSIAFRSLARLRQIAPELAAFRPGTPLPASTTRTATPEVSW